MFAAAPNAAAGAVVPDFHEQRYDVVGENYALSHVPERPPKYTPNAICKAKLSIGLSEYIQEDEPLVLPALPPWAGGYRLEADRCALPPRPVQMLDKHQE